MINAETFVQRVQELSSTADMTLGETLRLLERVFQKIPDEKVYEAYLFAYVRTRSGATVTELHYGPLKSHIATAIGVDHGKDGIEGPDTMVVLLGRVNLALAPIVVDATGQTQPADST